MKKFFLILFLFTSFLMIIGVNSMCAIEKDPNILTTCIQFDFTSVILDFIIKGEINFQPLCSLADRYIECIKVVSKGCIASNIGAGILTEIQNIALYCCDGITASTECMLNPNVQHTCIDSNANVRMSDGSLKKLKSLEIGDHVKTIDTNGHLIDTPVIMIMDISNESALFLNIKTKSNKSIRISRTHLVALANGDFKLAYKLKQDDSIVVFDAFKNRSTKEQIESISVELVQGYSAPVTSTGTILTDDVLLSCYALIESHQLAHFVMTPIRWIYMIYNYDFLPDYFVDILRVEKQSHGIHWYPKFLHMLSNNFNLVTIH